MDRRITALALLTFGLLATILMTLGLVDEILRTDIPATQKVFSAWIALVAISIAPFVAGLHFLVPLNLHRHPC